MNIGCFKIFAFLILVFLPAVSIAPERITNYRDDTQFRGYDLWITFNIGNKTCASWNNPLEDEIWDDECEDRALQYHYGNNAYKIKDYYNQFLEALKQPDKTNFASLLSYPFKASFLITLPPYSPRTKRDGIDINFISPQELIKNFDRINFIETKARDNKYIRLLPYYNSAIIVLEEVEVKIRLKCADEKEDIKSCENLILTPNYLYKSFDDSTARNYKLFYNVGEECLRDWTAQAQDNKLKFMYGPREKKFKDAYKEFISLLQKEDKLALSKMIFYPLVVNYLPYSSERGSPAYKAILYNFKDFINRYDEIFSSKVRESILATEYKDLFLSFTGINFYAWNSWTNDFPQIKYGYDLFLKFKCLDDDYGDPQTCTNYLIGFDKINLECDRDFEECDSE